MIKKAIKGEDVYIAEAAEIPNVLLLCPGCPHRSVFSVLKKLKIRLQEI